MSRRPTHAGPVRTIFFQVPSQYRKAVDKICWRENLRIKKLMLEAVTLVAVKHGIIREGDDLDCMVDFD